MIDMVRLTDRFAAPITPPLLARMLRPNVGYGVRAFGVADAATPDVGHSAGAGYQARLVGFVPSAPRLGTLLFVGLSVLAAIFKSVFLVRGVPSAGLFLPAFAVGSTVLGVALGIGSVAGAKSNDPLFAIGDMVGTEVFAVLFFVGIAIGSVAVFALALQAVASASVSAKAIYGKGATALRAELRGRGIMGVHVESPFRCAKPGGVSAPLRHSVAYNHYTTGVALP